MSRQATLVLNFQKSRGVINPLIYGHFSEHIGGVFYDGLWVGEDSPVENIRGFRKALVDSFRKLNPSVLRWPGGCFAETYNWRDGIGPRDQRPTRVNWWYLWDHRLESNAVGTHEFMDFCRMVGAKPYVAANITSLSPMDIRDWMEYCNFPEETALTRQRAENGAKEPFHVEFWGLGNENWGGGGRMTPEMYAREYIRYATVCGSLNTNNAKYLMCGASGHDLDWTRRILQEWKQNPAADRAPVWALATHYYCGSSGNPHDFTEDQWYELIFKADFMRRIVDDHRAVMDEYDPERKISLAIDEWGCWHPDGTGPSKGYNLFEQQSNIRDAVVAALTLNLFNNRCDVVSMANVAQLCNNLHSLYLASGENFVETVNYHVFDMFKTHQGASQIDTLVACETMEREGYRTLETLSASASEKDGKVTITLANLNMTEAQEVHLVTSGRPLCGKGEMAVLRADDVHTCNTFDSPAAVVPVRSEIILCGDDVITVPAASVVSIVIGKN